MGYCISMQKCKIFIKQEYKSEALKTLQEWAKTKERLMWVDIEYDILNTETLEEALENVRYECKTDDFGNIIYLEFIGEKLGDDTEIFNSIAKFFNKGSYIQMIGEDDCMWRWVFDGEKCKEVEPKISWE